jgi:putative lipoic acid-binding regulatory protein
MSEQQPPKIEFPCAYPIKVLGEAREDFIDTVFDLVKQHAPEIDRQALQLRDSRKGTFVSVHIVIVATGVDQLQNIHQSLLTYDAVKMVI